MDYIPINSIKDIDPKKISIRDINKRYMDREGNRYATRFNMQKRVVEIVRLARNPREAQQMRQSILKNKKDKLGNQLPSQVLSKEPGKTSASANTVQGRASQTPIQSSSQKTSPPGAKSSRTTPDTSIQAHTRSPIQKSADGFSDDLDMTDLSMDDDLGLDEFAEDASSPIGKTAPTPVTASTSPPDEDSDMEDTPTIEAVDSSKMLEQPFLDEVSQELDRLKERQILAINKMKDMQASLADSQALNELNREIDIQCWQAAEQAINYFKELYGYPRSLNQYVIKMDDDEKALLDKLPSDEERMTAIKRIESSRSLLRVLQSYRQKTTQLQKLIHDIPEQAIKLMPIARSKDIETIQTSLNLIIQHSERKIAELKSWQKRYAQIRVRH